ncbi:ROK family protein [Nocardioides marinquilinus]|uniref:ROK family protein n=1 Tax=Nocardioides marinquilinus TaxID=1210400 RepID=A0ABP9P9E2_9ACTN
MTTSHAVGVDFGGSGIKGAPVDLERGDFAADRVRIPTPDPSTPEAVAEVVAELLGELEGHDGPVGITVPGVVRGGTVHTAANIDPSWVGTEADALFARTLGRAVFAINDADAAGLAEVRFGAARGQKGVVVVTTLGTGIGSALLHDGVLVPSSELGHVEIDGRVAETWTANSVRERDDLSWDDWASRLTVYYRHLERLLSPDLFVVGGGVSKHAADFLPMVEIDTPIVPALLRNKAGIVGAALHAAGD